MKKLILTAITLTSAASVFAKPSINGRLAVMDYDEIIQKRVRRIARDHGCSVTEVNTALDHHPIELDRDTFLKRTLAMELVELDELQQAFREKALGDRDVASATLLVRGGERRSTLLGLNAPIGHAVQVVQHEPKEYKTSTEKLRGMLDNIMHISHRERQLLDRRELEGDSSPEVLDEINQLRAARGKPPLGETELT